MEHLKKRYLFPLQQVWGICSNPDATLRYESLLNVFYGKNVLKHYVMPLAELLLVAAFVGEFISSDMNLVSATIASLFSCFSFILSYGVLFFFVRWVSHFSFEQQVNDRNVSFLVSSLMSVTFVVKLFLSLMPNMFFVNLFYLYVFYLVWVMSEGVIDIAEEKRNKYMVIISFSVIVVPVFVLFLLKKMVPNL